MFLKDAIQHISLTLNFKIIQSYPRFRDIVICMKFTQGAVIKFAVNYMILFLYHSLHDMLLRNTWFSTLHHYVEPLRVDFLIYMHSLFSQ